MESVERQQIYNIIYNICRSHYLWNTLDVDRQRFIVTEIEKGCLHDAVHQSKIDGVYRLFTEHKFVSRYSTVCSKVLANISTNGLVGPNLLLTSIILGDRDPYKIASTTSIDLFPEASRLEREEIEKRKAVKEEIKVSKKYVCKRCGANETVCIEYQARCADELSSISIKCIQCNNVWRS